MSIQLLIFPDRGLKNAKILLGLPLNYHMIEPNMKRSPRTSLNLIRAMTMVIIASGLLASQASASVLLEMTFDNDGPTGTDTGTAANPYRTSPSDIVDSRITSIDRIGSGLSTPTTVISTGPQGGLAMSLSGTENAGYKVENGSSILFSAITYEVLVNITATSGFQKIFRQANQADTALGFVNGALAFNDILYNYTPNLGEWVHLAATVSWNGTNMVSQLYLNGLLLGTSTKAESASLQAFGTLNIGYYSVSTPEFINGQIDAIAVSNTILDPSQFVLPLPVPEPSAMVLVAVAGVSLIGYRLHCRQA